MSSLDRKLIRDLWRMKGQATAIILVIMCGVATFVMSLNTLGSLRRALDTYYERYRFAHVFASLKRAPNTLAQQIEEIPGVGQLQTRVVVQVTLDVTGFSEPAAGRLVSVPVLRQPSLNDLYLRAGRYLEPNRPGEILISEAFAQVHQLGPGSEIRAVINGRLQRLTIVGIALSPEVIYQIRPGDILPDDRRFAVIWMGNEELAAAFDLESSFNDVALSLMPGASEPEVIRQLDQLLEPYGGVGAFGRQDQPSHKFISNEMHELEGMARVVPTIFLAVAAFLLNVVISRLIAMQREQIATLKAFGYSRGELVLHYVKFISLFVVLGATLGTILGAWLGRGVTSMYTKFFHFPVFSFHLDPGNVVLAYLVTGGAALAGTLYSVLRSIAVPPAEAMRPEPPANFRPTFVERVGMQRFFSASSRMILRHLEREPVKAGLTIAGLSLAVAVLILGNFMSDSIEYVMESQFRFAQRQDVTVLMVEPSTPRVLHELRHLPGVRAVEPFRSISVRLRSGHLTRRLGIQGLRADAKLQRAVDVHRRAIPIPSEGIILSSKLAEVLEVKPGEMVRVEVLEGERPIHDVAVVGLIEDFTGLAAYMEIGAVHQLMQEGGTVSGAYLAVEAEHLDALYAELKQTPRVASVMIKEAALQSFRATVAENLLRMRFFNVLFASVIAFGVVYNSARIALAERSRELATLRVIGFTRGEISGILLGEQAVLVGIAIPLGLLAGYGLAAFVVSTAYDTELFRIPLVISPWTFGFAALVTLTAATASALIVRQNLDHLDLVAVLKSKE